MSDSSREKEYSPNQHWVRGSIWTIGLRWSLRLTGLISTVILARLLSPADYGIVAIAMIIVGTVEAFSNTGQYVAIIRHPNPTREHYDSAWTVGLLIGFGLGIVILAATPLTTAYFNEPRAAPVVAVLAFRIMLLGTQNIGVLNFRRNLQFHKQFWFNVYPTLISFVVTIAAAVSLRNYWALVVGIISQYVSAVTLSYIMEPFRPRISFTKVREIWSISIWSLVKSIGQHFNGQVDKIAIGGFGGAAAMGRYDVARDVAISPTQELIGPMVSVLLPVMATVQDDAERRRDLYLGVLYWSALICASTSVGVALIASDMAALVLGPQWHDVGVLMPWFALASGVQGVCMSVYSAFDTVGKAFISARLQWTRLVILVLTVVPVAYIFRDLEAVVIARFIVTVAVAPTLFYALSRELDVPLSDFMVALWRPFAAALAMSGAVLAVNAMIEFVGPVRLFLDMGIGAVTFGLSLMVLWSLCGRPDGPERILWKGIRPWLAPLRRKWVASKMS